MKKTASSTPSTVGPGTPDAVTVPFVNLTQASRVTGLSTFYLRNGCKTGEVPHVRSGKKYLINIPALLRKLDAEAGPIEERTAG